MATEFFSAPLTQQLMNGYIRDLEKTDTHTDFERERNSLIIRIFKVFLKNPDEWDERSAFNIEMIGKIFTIELEDKLMTEQAVNLIFTNCFRFCLEPALWSDESQSPTNPIKQVKDFGVYRYHEFDDRSKGQIDYALREMPIKIVRDSFEFSELKTYKDFMSTVKSSKQFASDWDEYIEDKNKQIDKIKTTLEGYQNAFNFVGLYDGFKSLGEQKTKEIFWSRILLIMLAIAIPCPLVAELFYTITLKPSAGLFEKLGAFLPLFSLTLILIYYFRVALNNHTSIKAQILQIELRKSLCQFIQSYADYSKKINEANSNSLAKFEEVIFSNIMPNQEKIPSTFDGIEQIATLISAIKPK